MDTNIIFLDDYTWDELRPLTLTRPVSEIRIGILTVREKWMRYLHGSEYSYITRDYLSKRFQLGPSESNLIINSAVLPDFKIAEEILKLQPSQLLLKEGSFIAANSSMDQINDIVSGNSDAFIAKEYTSEVVVLKSFCDIFSFNAQEIIKDFELFCKNRRSQQLSKSNNVIGTNQVFIEEGAVVECCTINVNDGPVYIGKDAEVMEGCLIRGPFAMGEHSSLKMGAKIYGGTTIGPHCKVGGEVNNSVFFGYSNKAHDGFLGNSVIGEWVNIGADSNNSNLKNNYAPVKMWNYGKKRFVNTGLTFAGLIMGDHSKCSINTMFNTGTVCGVSCNLYGAGFHRNFIPSFTWGSPAGYSRFDFNKAFEVAEIMMKRRGLTPEESEKEILHHLFSQSEEGI